MYNSVAPVVKPNITSIEPIHLPNTKPPIKKIGEPKPNNKHHIQQNIKKIMLNRKILPSLS